MRSARRLGVGLVDKKSGCTGSSGEMPFNANLPACIIVVHFLSCLHIYSLACRVIELATVEPQISLHEQNSFTPASGKTSISAISITALRLFLVPADWITSHIFAA